MTNEKLHLDWHGPYAVIDGQSDPNLFEAKPLTSASQGVYVWTIHIGNEFWVYYVGKAQDKKGIIARLRTEFHDRDPQKAYIDDAEKLLNGERVPLYKPLNSKGTPDVASWVANPDHFTDNYRRFRQIIRVFIAPIPNIDNLVPFAEKALTWLIWDYEWDNWGERSEDAYFYINVHHNAHRRPNAPWSITMTSPFKIRGFETVNEYTEPRT